MKRQKQVISHWSQLTNNRAKPDTGRWTMPTKNTEQKQERAPGRHSQQITEKKTDTGSWTMPAKTSGKNRSRLLDTTSK